MFNLLQYCPRWYHCPFIVCLITIQWSQIKDQRSHKCEVTWVKMIHKGLNKAYVCVLPIFNTNKVRFQNQYQVPFEGSNLIILIFYALVVFKSPLLHTNVITLKTFVPFKVSKLKTKWNLVLLIWKLLKVYDSDMTVDTGCSIVIVIALFPEWWLTSSSINIYFWVFNVIFATVSTGWK